MSSSSSTNLEISSSNKSSSGSNSDIREFIELMYELDTDRDYFLIEQEFLQVVDKFRISPSSDYTALVFQAMSNRTNSKISFSKTRTIFEASISGYYNPTVCQMLFKGISRDEKMYLSLEEFKRIARAIEPNRDSAVVEAIYWKNRNETFDGISYKDVARSLFNYHPSLNENPFTHPIKFVSPHSQVCCLF